VQTRIWHIASITNTAVNNCVTFDLYRSYSLTVWLVTVVAGGAAGFSLLWDWDLPTSSYFTWSTVSGTGMGDTAPADSLTFILLGGPVILGMAFYNLWQNTVVAKIDDSLSKMLHNYQKKQK